MSQAQRIIQKFGGIRPMSRITGDAPSTIQRWADSGWISAKRQADILAKGQKAGIDIAEADFFAPTDSGEAA